MHTEFVVEEIVQEGVSEFVLDPALIVTVDRRRSDAFAGLTVSDVVPATTPCDAVTGFGPAEKSVVGSGPDTPAVNEIDDDGYVGAFPAGLVVAPLHAVAWLPVNEVAVLPPASTAVRTTVNATPAAGELVDGDTRNDAAAPADTVIDVLTALVSEASVAVSV